MERQNFNITWYQPSEPYPKIDEVCPKCQVGQIRKSQFNEGNYCPNCKWSWRPSKFVKSATDFKTTPEIKKENEDFEVEDEADKILKEIKNFEIRLMAYLKSQFEA